MGNDSSTLDCTSDMRQSCTVPSLHSLITTTRTINVITTKFTSMKRYAQSSISHLITDVKYFRRWKVVQIILNYSLMVIVDLLSIIQNQLKLMSKLFWNIFTGERPFLYNRLYKSQPLMIHTPGYCRNLHNILADFIPKVWEPEEGEDVACLMDNKDLYEAQPHEYPVVMIAVLIDTIRTSLKEFLIKLHSLAYTKEKIHLYFRYGVMNIQQFKI